MFVTGVGVGPTFAVFTLVVQNSVPVAEARDRDQQPDVLPVGRRHGRPGHHRHDLRDDVDEEAPRQLAAADLPPELVAGFAGSGFRPDQVAGVGDLGASILAQVPEAFRAQVEPFIPAIVDAIHQAFSIATANTFLIGIGASLLAAGLVAALKEVPMGHEVLTATADSAATHAERSLEWARDRRARRVARARFLSPVVRWGAATGPALPLIRPGGPLRRIAGPPFVRGQRPRGAASGAARDAFRDVRRSGYICSRDPCAHHGRKGLDQPGLRRQPV